jgi:sec-independent protein translocase protein TatB
MHFGDSIFIFLLALVLFGPKKLPEIGRQVGKLLAEFRRASNEFKYQIQEEMRNLEEEERRKKAAEREAQAKAQAEAAAPAALPAETAPAGPTILPPSTGSPVSNSYSLGYSYPGPAVETVQDATAPAEIQADPPSPTEPAPAPEVVISPELIAPPAEPLELNAPVNGSHGTAHGEAQEPAPEVAHHD